MAKDNKRNIDYGFMIKNMICQKYKLEVDDKTKNKFEIFYNADIEKQVKQDVDDIMGKISNKRPKKYIDKTIDNAFSIYGADFILTYGKTMSINKCKKYAPINVYGQIGVKSFNYRFADILDENVTTLEQIKKLYKNKLFLAKIIPRWLDSFLSCDINVFLSDNKVYVIKKLTDELIIDAEKIDISNSIKYPHIS